MLLTCQEFLLGLFNFVNLDKEEKVSLIFQLFDEDRSGFLSEDEVGRCLSTPRLRDTSDNARGPRHDHPGTGSTI